MWRTETWVRRRLLFRGRGSSIRISERRPSEASSLLCLLAAGSILMKNLSDVTYFVSYDEVRGHFIYLIQHSGHYNCAEVVFLKYILALVTFFHN